jgi:hypothetical protein
MEAGIEHKAYLRTLLAITTHKTSATDLYQQSAAWQLLDKVEINYRYLNSKGLL